MSQCNALHRQLPKGADDRRLMYYPHASCSLNSLLRHFINAHIHTPYRGQTLSRKGGGIGLARVHAGGAERGVRQSIASTNSCPGSKRSESYGRRSARPPLRTKVETCASKEDQEGILVEG